MRSSSPGSSSHRVPAAGHAGPERALVIRAPARHGALLLRHVTLLLHLHLPLLLLLLLRPTHSPYAAEESAHPGSDGRAFPGVTADGPTDRAQRRSARGAAEHPALRLLRLPVRLRRR